MYIFALNERRDMVEKRVESGEDYIPICNADRLSFVLLLDLLSSFLLIQPENE